MTTIATDGNCMAADSQTVRGWIRMGSKTKVHRTKDGRLFGSCGNSIDCVNFAAWAEGGARPVLSGDFEALILNADGTIDFIDEHLMPLRIVAPSAIGTGGDIAKGAMLAGASPERAVEIAISVDIGSGGPVTVEHL